MSILDREALAARRVQENARHHSHIGMFTSLSNTFSMNRCYPGDRKGGSGNIHTASKEEP